MLFEGDYDKATKTLTTTGTGKGPDGKPAKYKSVTVMKDKNHHTSKLLIVAPDGSENPMITVEYRRKK